MLIHKDLKGDAGGPEHQALKGMLDVGNTFMTDRRDGSVVQRSGEFVTMRRTGGEVVQLVSLWEPPDARRLTDGYAQAVPDDVAPPAPGAPDAVPRVQLMASALDEQQGPLSFGNLAASKLQTRVPRFTRVETRVETADHATKNGKRRLFSLGDGTVLLVREVSAAGDTRYFAGMNAFVQPVRRVSRCTGVELVRMDPDRPAGGKVLLSFGVHSGLGFDPGSRSIDFLADNDLLYDANKVYAPNAGLLFGRVLLSMRADPSSTYAVAEPAMAKQDGKSYLSLVAVHGLAEDCYHPDSSGLYRLTCTRTTADGVQTSKISMPAAVGPGQYMAPVEMDLVRLSPQTLVLSLRMTTLRLPGAGSVSAASAGWAYLWSDDNGASWVHVPHTGITDGNAAPVIAAMVPRDKDTLLLVSALQLDSLVPAPDAASVQVYAFTRTGATRISTIPGSRFSAGLHAGDVIGGLRHYPPYWAVGYGGGVRVDRKPLLWVQFDPQYIHAEGSPGVIDYPGGRAQLMVSADGGATWERRMLPQPWPQRVGFVVALDQRTLAIPVYGPRQTDDSGAILPLAVKLHTSRDGGKRWRATALSMRLPYWAWVDGQLLPGSSGYDIDDSRFDFNRGELFPLLSLRDDNGELLPMNPGRPWMADHRAKEPANG